MSAEVVWPKQARGRERVEGLLRAAAELIAEQGVEGVAFSEIARRTGTAQGSLYQYFPSKDALVIRLHGRLVDDLAATVSACSARFLATDGPRDVAAMLDSLLPELARFYAAHPAYREIRHALSRNPAIQSAELQADSRVAGILSDMLSQAGVMPNSLMIEAMIELGDALLPWSEEDPLRLAEVRKVFLGYLRPSVAG
jgi:AcrR family transcriptional regulator